MNEKTTKFNGPAEFEMKVWVINEKSGRSGQIIIALSVFEYPTIDKIKEEMEKITGRLKEEGLPGFRLMTKEEAVAAWGLKVTGSPISVEGSNDWDQC